MVVLWFKIWYVVVAEPAILNVVPASNDAAFVCRSRQASLSAHAVAYWTFQALVPWSIRYAPNRPAPPVLL